jgi:HlyD family secretion protein
MGDTEAMAAVAEVYETDVQFVRPDNRATVTSGAFPERITGRVERIGALIHKSDVLGIDPTAAADARIVEVRIRLDSSATASHYNRHQVHVAIETGLRGAASDAAGRSDRAR